MNAEQILALPLDPANDAGAATVRDYLVRLLSELWTYREGFSGKRPFGNSGWEYDLYIPLIRGGHVNGTLDEDGCCVDDVDEVAAYELIGSCILALGQPKEDQ